MRGWLLGRGRLRSIAGTQPAAGADISEAVPTGKVWRLLSFRATLVASAQAANRQAGLRFDDGSAVFFEAPPKINQVASATQIYQWHGGSSLGNTISLTAEILFDADLLFLAGYRIKTNTLSIQTSDQWGAPQYLVEEWS